MIHTPNAMATAASARTRVTRSRSTTAPSAAPNTIEVSRTAATAATGARVIAHSASVRSEEHTSELQSRRDLVCRLLLEKKKNTTAAHLHDSESACHGAYPHMDVFRP